MVLCLFMVKQAVVRHIQWRVTNIKQTTLYNKLLIISHKKYHKFNFPKTKIYQKSKYSNNYHKKV
jgi:hypothetical protein